MDLNYNTANEFMFIYPDKFDETSLNFTLAPPTPSRDGSKPGPAGWLMVCGGFTYLSFQEVGEIPSDSVFLSSDINRGLTLQRLTRSV